MNKRLFALALLPAIAITGCLVDDEASTDPEPRPTDGFKVQYVPSAGIGPFPNDLYFGDGSVRMPTFLEEGEDLRADAPVTSPVEALSALDGFSTISPQYIGMTDEIDAGSLEPGENFILYDIGNDVELSADEDYSVRVVDEETQGLRVLEVLPLRPLAPGGQYALVLTDGIESRVDEIEGGLQPDRQFRLMRDAIAADEEFSDELAEELLGSDAPQSDRDRMQAIYEEIITPAVEIGESLGVAPDEMAVAATFRTQSIFDGLEAAAEGIEPRDLDLDYTGQQTGDGNIPGEGDAHLWIGETTLPYYLHDNVPADEDESGFHALNSYWVHEDEDGTPRHIRPDTAEPMERSVQTVPVFVITPDEEGAEPGDGWPVIIFQHGLTQNRMNLVALADVFAEAGYAAVAIDHPLHGLESGSARLLWSSILDGDTDQERHFDMDADGEVDADSPASGAHYVNIQSLLTSRDNLRQSVVDILQITASVAADDRFDGDDISFVGHSLGGITGASAVALSEDLEVATLGMPGGNFRELFRESQSFSDPIADGLEQQGIARGSRAFDTFFRQAQTLVDAGDPSNYGVPDGGILSQDDGIHMISVVGTPDDPAGEDTVVPNVSTNYLANAMELEGTDETVSAGIFPGDRVRALVCFSEGEHGSLLQVGDGTEEATEEMQAQMMSFIESEGDELEVTDDSVLLDPEDC